VISSEPIDHLFQTLDLQTRSTNYSLQHSNKTTKSIAGGQDSSDEHVAQNRGTPPRDFPAEDESVEEAISQCVTISFKWNFKYITAGCHTVEFRQPELGYVLENGRMKRIDAMEGTWACTSSPMADPAVNVVASSSSSACFRSSIASVNHRRFYHCFFVYQWRFRPCLGGILSDSPRRLFMSSQKSTAS
jgi:hypothetical protein